MNKKIVIGAVVVGLGLGGYFLINRVSGREVRVSKVEMGNLSSSILYAGIVTPGEIIPVYVEAPVLVESIIARVGQEVEVGDSVLRVLLKMIKN